MTQLEYIHLYIFDIFDKTNSQEIIQKLDQFGVAKEEHGSMSIIDTGKKIDVSKKRWQITDLSDFLKQIEKINSEFGLPDTSVTRKSITKIEFIGIQNDELPYFTLLMSVTVDGNKLDYEKLYNDVNNLLRPLRLYMEEFQGMIRKLFSPKPICPYFVDVGILTSKEEMQEIFNNSKELLEGESIPYESTKLDYMIMRSAKLRKVAPLNTLPYSFNLLSIIKLYSNTASFVGHLEQTSFNGLMTPFVITFSQEKLWNKEFAHDAVLTIRASGYNDFSPWGSTGTILYLVTMYAWLLHLERILDGMELELKELRNKIRSGLKEEKKTDLEKYVIELNEKGSMLADFLAEVGRLGRSNKISLREFLDGRTSTSVEIPVPPATKGGDFYFWSMIKDATGSGAYIQSIALKINYLLKKLHVTLEQFNDENENLSNRLNTLARIQAENTMKKQNERMVVSTIALIALTVIVAVLTCVLAYYAILEHAINDFEPYLLPPDGGEMKLYGGFNTLYNSQPEIKVGAKTNHFLSFTVTNVTFLGGSTWSNCYFTKKPDDVKLWQKDSTIVGTNGGLESLKPFITMDFSVNSTYWDSLYTNEKKMPSDVGTLIFDIDVFDLQDTTKKPLHQQAFTHLIANLSSDIMQKNCH